MKIAVLILFFAFFVNDAFSQNCSDSIGQNPSHAIPVCGTSIFSQPKLSNCIGPSIPTTCPITVTSSSSFWYKFHCYQTGTLGFIINGVNSNDDYDWEVFDITGVDPNTVFTDPALQVSLNLYGTLDFDPNPPNPPFPNTPTGCTLTGTLDAHCDADAPTNSPFNRMPVITIGHDYLIMITNFSTSGFGYNLSFEGGSAIINDPVSPAILSAAGSCDNLQVTLKLSKKMKCNSLAADGSDFKIDYAGTAIISAASASCSANFDTDSLILTLSNPLPTGTYQVTAQNGTDANTMLDYCETPIPVGNTVFFNVVGLGTADFNFSGSNCVNSAITFTDASTPAADITNWHWDMGDGTILDNTNGNPFTHTYLTAGPFTVTLTVTNSNGCVSAVFSKQLTINALPVAVAAGTTTVCLNAASPNIIFTGSGGTAPYTFSYTINNIAQTPVQSNNAGVYTFAVPTAVAGTFTYAITNIQEGSGNLCAQNLTGISASVTVNALPTATISGSTEVCAGSTPPVITFTGAGGTPPYTFTYHVTINGVTSPDQTVTGNPATVTLPNLGMWLPTPTNPNIPPFYTYVYTLVSVQEGSSLQCGQLQTGDATVIVDQQPLTNAIVLPPYCGSTTVQFFDALTYFPPQQIVNLVSWTWDFGDPASGANNTSILKNPVHIYAAPGLYTITHTSTSDKGCTGGGVLGTIRVNERPHADFIPPEVCLNDTYAQFTNSSSIVAGTLTYDWDFGDPPSGASNSSTAQNPQHSYAATGPYNVRLITTSNFGCKDTITKQIFVNGSFPKAIFTVAGETSLCVNKPVSITNTSTVFPGNITKLEITWDDVNAPTVIQTDDNPFTGSVYTHLYPDFNTPLTKNVTVHVRAYSGGICANDSVHTITLHASPQLQFKPIPDTCLLAVPFLLTQASEIAGVPGTGVYSGTGIITPGGLFSPQVAGAGTHTITYTYTSNTPATGCTASITGTIKVLDTASARFSYIMPACDKAQIIFNDESIVPAGVINANTIWDFNDGSAIETHTAGIPFTHVFPAWGTYHVKMFTRSAYGCNSTVITKDVIIHPIPQPAFTFPGSVCLPHADILFTNTSTIADGSESKFTYLWHFGDAASGAADSSKAFAPVHHYITTGPFKVDLQVTAGSGCKHDTTIILDVVHPQPKADFTTSRKTACLGEDIIFTNITDPLQGNTAAINWDMGDNSSTAFHTPTVDYTYLDTLTYRVSLYITNSIGCNSDTMYRDMKVYPNPVVDAGPDRVVLEGTTLKMKPVVQGVEMKYLWTPDIYFKNGINTILAPTAVDLKDDITYTLQVAARGGCMRMDQVYIKVLKNPIIPNTFTPNGDGVNERWEIKYLKDFPDSRVQVFTRAGQKVFESSGYGKAWDGKYKGKPLPFDTYYYIIEPGSGHGPLTGYVTILK